MKRNARGTFNTTWNRVHKKFKYNLKICVKERKKLLAKLNLCANADESLKKMRKINEKAADQIQKYKIIQFVFGGITLLCLIVCKMVTKLPTNVNSFQN